MVKPWMLFFLLAFQPSVYAVDDVEEVNSPTLTNVTVASDVKFNIPNKNSTQDIGPMEDLLSKPTSGPGINENPDEKTVQSMSDKSPLANKSSSSLEDPDSTLSTPPPPADPPAGNPSLYRSLPSGRKGKGEDANSKPKTHTKHKREHGERGARRKTRKHSRLAVPSWVDPDTWKRTRIGTIIREKYKPVSHHRIIKRPRHPNRIPPYRYPPWNPIPSPVTSQFTGGKYYGGYTTQHRSKPYRYQRLQPTYILQPPRYDGRYVGRYGRYGGQYYRRNKGSIYTQNDVNPTDFDDDQRDYQPFYTGYFYPNTLHDRYINQVYRV